MELIKITDRISYLPGEQRTDRPLLYYIRGDRYSVAVDAGNSRAHVELFYSALTAAGLPLPKLTVLTHWHWDHTFGLPYIHGASIATAKTQEKLREAAQWAWTREAMDAREQTGEDIAFCNGCIREEYADLSEIRVQPADMGIDSLMTLDLGGVTLHLIPTDSVHSRDAMLIWAPEEKALIAGDAECEDFYEGHGRANPERIAAYVKLLDSFDFDFYCYGHIPPVDRAGILREMAEMTEKYSYEITAVEEPDRRAAYAEAVLHALPEWFGIPESTAAYIAESRRQPFWAALHGDEVWGFIALQETSPAAVELAVMGVRPELHHSGMGRALFDAARAWAKAAGYRMMQVKTVREGCYPCYDRTNAFYRSLGFAPLECFPTLWGERNPCMVYVMEL